MLDQILNVVTITTVATAIMVGIILGTIWLPIFERTIGARFERRLWGVFWGLEIPGAALLLGMAVARYVDGGVWPAWLGMLALWTIMVTAAAVTRRLA